MRVKGKNAYCHVVCNPLYTVYSTKPKKDRQTIIEVLRNSAERSYLLNEEAFSYLETLGLSKVKREHLQDILSEETLSERAFLDLLQEQGPALGPQQQRQVLDAAAIAAYNAQMEWPVIKLLLVDDAPEFKLVTAWLALCWVHEARHYKKFNPMVAHHQQVLNSFMTQFWQYYAALLAYREEPTPEQKNHLTAEFERIFAQKTNYWLLNERLALTFAKQQALLMVLDHPEIPLHNNASELAARTRVRKRKISYGTRSDDGTRAWDTFMTLSQTAKKLNVSFYHYIHDRISAAYALPSLAHLIFEQAHTLDLDASWLPP